LILIPFPVQPKIRIYRAFAGNKSENRSTRKNATAWAMAFERLPQAAG
jgi:hypothetical protein